MPRQTRKPKAAVTKPKTVKPEAPKSDKAAVTSPGPVTTAASQPETKPEAVTVQADPHSLSGPTPDTSSGSLGK